MLCNAGAEEEAEDVLEGAGAGAGGAAAGLVPTVAHTEEVRSWRRLCRQGDCRDIHTQENLST